MVEWFRHDTDARNDIKVRKLLRDSDMGALGAYWLCVEILYQAGGYVEKTTLSDELSFYEADRYLPALLSHNLIEDVGNDVVTSQRVLSEIKWQEDSRQKKSIAGKKGNDIRWAEHRNAIAMQSQCDRTESQSNRTSSQTIAQDKTIQVKKDISLSKDSSISKEKVQLRFTKPSVDEVRSYCTERNNGVDPESFWDFYESKGWKVGNTPMKDWQAAVRTWEKSGSRAPAAQRKKMVTDKSKRSEFVNPDGTLNLLG